MRQLVISPVHEQEPVAHVVDPHGLATAVSGTVGIGNIGGVAVAISLGGPGAAFWLIVAGFLGMSSKFVECTLGVIFRRENPDETVSGGRCTTWSAGLAQRGLPMLGKIMGSFYALGIVVGCLGIVSGGAPGVMIIGFQRAAFSNEAGLGSATIAHSAVRMPEPVTEGIVALLEPVIDTIVICTATTSNPIAE